MTITKQEVLENIEKIKEYVAEIENKKEEKVIGIAIKNRFTGLIIFQSTKTIFKDAVNEYVSQENLKGNRANLTDANFTRADLTDADLTGADLTGADLTRADLTGADLTRANLTGANLTDANFTRANLTDADLTGADLTRANLTRADLTGADLTRANLTGCKYYMGQSNKNFEALCKAIKTIKWNLNTGADFIK